MIRPAASPREKEQFLGEIQTEIARSEHYQAHLQAGQAIKLRREPNNNHGPTTIRVENEQSQAFGYVPRRTAAWLSPLIDSGKIRIEGYIPAVYEVIAADSPAVPLVLMVFLTQVGLPIVRCSTAEDRLNNLHALALQALEDVQSMEDPAEIVRFTRGLKRIAQEEVLPETQLLLALIPGVVR